MKNFNSLPVVAAFVAISVSSVSAQNGNMLEDGKAKAGKNCHAMEVLAENMKEDAGLKDRMAAVEKFTEKYLAQRANATSAVPAIVTIPVYVHVLYNTAAENISDAQIASQIAVMNEDFRKMNADVSKTPSNFAGVVADCGIQFTLAGITRKATTKTSWGTRDAMKKPKSGGIAPITPETHLNMWSCNIGNGILGYAQFPGGALATDGVVANPTCFGSSAKGSGFNLGAPYDLGRTMTHEVGHWLNLRHIWGDATCGNDFVADTPTHQTSNFGCPAAGFTSCSNVNMTMNYMDYTDDRCMYMFTNGQKDRMRALFEVGGARAAMGGNVANLGEGATVSSVKLSKELSLDVYPNPATDEATISINTGGREVALKVTDIQGKVIETKSFPANEGSVNHTLKVAGLEKGIYFVNVIGADFNETKKLVVQ